jgi:hypothetical protein
MLAVIAVLLWGVAVALALLPGGNPVPVVEAVEVAAEDIDSSPRNVPMKDDAVAVIAVYPRKCMDCHDGLVDNVNPRLDVNQYHETVVMNHGLNGRCVNCHHQEDRNSLVMRNGEKLGFGQSVKLCSNCHGPSYRQWQRGVHGKTLGYWDETKGEKRKLTCVECHDPHSPHYNPMKPLPGPNTLRMGEQDPQGHGHGDVSHLSPLMRNRPEAGEEHHE